MATTELVLKPLARPAWLPEDVWPFETMMLAAEGSAIAVTDVGRGPALLFYTGIGSFVWRDLMLRLSGDFRCIGVDPPGIGLSARISRSDVTLAHSARAVVATIDALDLQGLTLVVHDSGGPPALAAAVPLTRDALAVPTADFLSHEVRGIAHRKMVASGNDELAGRGEPHLPLRLKLQRIVALAENRQ